MLAALHNNPLGRKVLAIGVLAAAGAGLLALTPTASASQFEPTHRKIVRRVPAPQPVTVVITHRGRYVTATCAMDILEGRCQFDIKRGQTRTFTVKPPAGSPISIRVVPNRGDSTEAAFPPKAAVLCFVTAGNRNHPTVTQVACH
jgi:hypothetical protein